MRKLFLLFALAVGLLTSASTAMAQTVNMSRYITLTVAKDSAIRLNFMAAAAATPVRIVSGSNTEDITVNTGWKGTVSYTAGSTTMTVYGDIIGFDCSVNGANLTAIDVSHNTQLKRLSCSFNSLTSLDVSKNTQLTNLWCGYNNLTSLDVSKNTQLTYLDCSSSPLSSLDVSKNTQLTELYCWGNKFTTAALDAIYCALPARSASDGARIFPLNGSSSAAEQNMVASTNAANATTKNWKVLKFKEDGNHTDIATTGSYVCSGGGGKPNMNSYITLTVTDGAAIKLNFRAAAANTPVRIVSGSNTQDITVGTDWYNGSTPSTYTVTARASTMTVYGDMIMFSCSENGANLTAIDVSKNTQLRLLGCSSNQLSSLDLSKNTELFLLSCNDNKLTSLDISKKSKLKEIYCYDNNFTTATLDDIYCSLPDRTGTTFVKIQPVYNSSSSNLATVLATNAANATAKNWKVQYYKNNSDITTTGSYDCSTAVAEAAAEPALTLYPNPVADVLYLSATARTIRVYDIYGTEVAHATDTDRVEVSHLPAGIYTVKADGTVAKMVKR